MIIKPKQPKCTVQVNKKPASNSKIADSLIINKMKSTTHRIKNKK